ncbi:MAG: DUF4395 domain-containing protein [Thiotrichales bacterium]
MNVIFGFGERVEGYDVPVLNEREVRASAGILFFFAMLSFLNAWLVGDFRPTRVFVVAFLIDFIIRVFVNPRFAPTMILGRFVVSKQVPEYVGARQKRFAWGIALALAVAMFYLVVLNRMVGPINLLICASCLLLLFFEAAFGICLACKIHGWFFKDKTRLCPGGTCELLERAPIQRIDVAQVGVVAAFLLTMGLVIQNFAPPHADAVPLSTSTPPVEPGADGECTPPDWVVAMGHAEKWKLHHNCK